MPASALRGLEGAIDGPAAPIWVQPRVVDLQIFGVRSREATELVGEPARKVRGFPIAPREPLASGCRRAQQIASGDDRDP